MENYLERFGPALDRFGCALLNTVGAGATEVGLGLLIAPGFNVAGAKTFGIGMLTSYAAEILCNYQEGGQGPTGENYCQVNTTGVCVEWEAGEGQLTYEYDGEFTPVGFNYQKLLSISCNTTECEQPDSKGYCFTYRDIEYTRVDGTLQKSNVILRYRPGQVPLLGSVPVSNDDPAIPDGQCTTKPRFEPFETLDGNNCNITMQAIGFAATPGGKGAPVALIEPGLQKQKWLDEEQWKRPGPGVIADTQARDYSQTCEFAPTLVYPTPGGDPVYVPIEPGEDIEEALKRLSSDMNDRFNDVDGELGDIGDKLDEILEDLEDFDPGDPIQIPGGKVTFNAVCDKDESGNLEKVEYPLLPAGDLSSALVALYDNQTTIMTMLQQHLMWKTPICPPEKPELKGDFVTVRFESDSKSPNGERPLRKLLRYRSQSSRDLGQLTDYWKSFTWRTGPVCVYHKGSAVGTPQVWASTADEGKRVLRHAFGEAGVDPDQTGEWGISGSDNPRYGVSLTVRVASIDGGHWVTSREGPDGLPLLAVGP